MKQKLKVLPAILMVIAFSTSIKPIAQTVYPYLQSCTPTSIYITWKTSSNTQSLVQYGTNSTNLSTSVNGTNQIWSDNGYYNNYYYHTVQLTGLTPNTKYYYKVTSGTSTSAVACFKTMPNPGGAATADGHFRFLIMGDNQIKEGARYDSLMSAAKRKLAQKYGGDPCDNASLIFNVGDQVDVGTLDHYENVHFKKSKALSPYLPIQTTVGNHELYGTLQMNAYKNHFYYSQITYQGISSGTEEYYAYQAGPVLFISLTTENSAVNSTQMTWLQQVVTAANSDGTVQWIVSLGHRPYQAEQYVGDISPWIRNTVVPYLITSNKYAMHIGAHHHVYSRGQLKNAPVYNIISGGTAWDQYWGMAVEQDMDDVQKTISNWIYNIVDIEVATGKMNVESYSIGSIYAWKNNELMDEFHRCKNRPAPTQPAITNTFPTSVSLPYTVNSSAFSSTAGETLNSTEFQFSQSSSFATIEKTSYRDFENWFGKGSSPDVTVNLNAGVNILNYTIPSNGLTNGVHYVRVRHRDKNMEWSTWSPIKSFTVGGSVVGTPTITTSKSNYVVNETITVNYSNAPGGSSQWIGLYKKGNVPGAVASTKWSYVTGVSGSINFTNLSPAEEYFIAFFGNGTYYTEIAPRVTIYVGPMPALTTSLPHYNVGDAVFVNFATCPTFTNDWVGIYKVGQTPGVNSSTKWSYITTTSGSRTFTGLPKGYYYANYFLKDGYTEVSQRIFFSVGDQITNLTTDKSVYNVGEYITATWTDGAGILKDYLAFFHSGDNPNIHPLVGYTYFGGVPNGTKVIQNDPSTTVPVLPETPGDYFLVMFTNDSYNEISNRVYFSLVPTNKNLEVTDVTETMLENEEDGIKIYPNPMTTNGNSIIESKYPIDRLEFLDGLGRIVYKSENVNTKNFSLINIDLPEGCYYVRVYQDNRTMSEYKLIVNR